MEFEFWWLLALPVFFGMGWVAARVDIKSLLSESRALPSSYFRGLNFLLNERTFLALARQELAEEVIQETYVKIWNSAGQFNPGLSSPITWMASIARNRAIDVVRKRTEVSIEEEPTALEVAAEGHDPLARREMTEELKRLLECVGRLEPERQKLVLLAYYNGWSREQLAAKFETPVNTVKTWLRRSMMDIRECLGLSRPGS